MPEPSEKQIEQLLKSIEESADSAAYPNFRKGFAYGVGCGVFGFILVMLILGLLSKMSLWGLAVLVGALLLIIVGVLVAFHPQR